MADLAPLPRCGAMTLWSAGTCRRWAIAVTVSELARWLGPGGAPLAWPAGTCPTRLAVVR